MSKIRLLVLSVDNAGVGKFRFTDPHIMLQKNFKDEFHVDIMSKPPLHEKEFYSNYDVIFAQGSLVMKDEVFQLFELLKKEGLKIILDLDDYWRLDPSHAMYKRMELSWKKLATRLNIADLITTTTKFLASKISRYNKNVAVIPNAINPNEKQFQPNSIESDRVRIGWVGGSCYDDKTEVLTNNGFKLFEELDKKDLIATLNPINNELEYHKPINYIKKEYNGLVNCGKNKFYDYVVTPNHNMYCSKAKSLTHKTLDLELKPSRDIHGLDIHMKKDCIWNGKSEEYFILPAIENTSEIKIEMDDWLKFFGFWLGDGWTSNYKYGYQTGIVQVKDNDYLESINSIMEKYGFKPYKSLDKPQYRYCNKQLWSYLTQFGKASEKFIPQEILNLSTEQLNIFLTWYLNADGHIDKNGRKRAWTVSKELAGNLQEIALKTGRTSVTTSRGVRTSIISDRIITGKYDCYQVGFSKSSFESNKARVTPLLRGEDQFTKEYSGYVYCVEVPNHIIFVRRNGKPFWCGNSHQEDLKLLHGVFGKLKAVPTETQLIMCGFNDLSRDIKTGEITKVEFPAVWMHCEHVLTQGYSVNEPYKHYLLRPRREEYPNVENERYRRIWTKDISEYGTCYNHIDISLAPLVNNEFNAMKSQLKVLEAGFHKKPLIASEIEPYMIDCVHGKNALLVSERKAHKDWFKNIKKLVESSEMREDLGETLYETVKDKYDLNKVTNNRRQAYRNLF